MSRVTANFQWQIGTLAVSLSSVPNGELGVWNDASLDQEANPKGVH